jgi:hypothetical protein
MLDSIVLVEFRKNGVPLKWFKYLLIKMLQACTDVEVVVTLVLKNLSLSK